IKTLDDLKDRLAKVILMILIVMFFKHVLCSSFEEPLNILCLAGGILLISLALYFGHIAHKAED
ncbi:YqhA family protein, partial [bacterium]|nr:YqhA family protein [bacterium]